MALSKLKLYSHLFTASCLTIGLYASPVSAQSALDGGKPFVPSYEDPASPFINLDPSQPFDPEAALIGERLTAEGLVLLGILNAQSDPYADFDGDGYNNGEELAIGTNPYDSENIESYGSNSSAGAADQGPANDGCLDDECSDGGAYEDVTQPQ